MSLILLEQIVSIIILVLMIAVIAFLFLMFLSGIISNIYGAPYVPISKKYVKDLLIFGGLKSNDIFYDLGSGDGRVLVAAAIDFGIKNAAGYEISFWPYWESRFLLWQRGLSKMMKIHRLDFFRASFSDATFVYMYLFPKLVDRLAQKISDECKPGTKILCPSFPIDFNRHPEFKLLKSEKIGKIAAYLYEKI